MVDFNAEKTVGTPAVDIVRVLWLQARANFLEAWEAYQKQQSQGVDADLSIVKARLYTLFLEMAAYLERTLPKKPKEGYSYIELKELIKKENLDVNEIFDIITFLNSKLDRIRLIRIDTKQSYDRTNWEEENQNQGL